MPIHTRIAIFVMELYRPGLITRQTLPILMQVQSTKQANSVLKRSLADGVDAMKPAEVQSVISIPSLSS